MPATHHSKIARRLQAATNLTYQQALTQVKNAAAAGQLPRTLDADGIARAIATLTHSPTTSPVTTSTVAAPALMHEFRYEAFFVPQAWVNDNAIEIDATGPRTWDCTRFALANLDYLKRLTGETGPRSWEPNGSYDEVLDNDDVFMGDPDAPAWVRDHQGPYDIYIRRILNPEAFEFLTVFTPQATLDGIRGDVDPRGQNTWNSTEFVRSHLDDLEPMQEWLVTTFRDRNGAMTHDYDRVLMTDPNAPEWVRNWQGPSYATAYALIKPLPAEPAATQTSAAAIPGAPATGHPYRYFASFTPQAYINGHAVEIDPSGPVTWDCTGVVLKNLSSLDDRNEWHASVYDGKGAHEILDMDDVLAADKGAPEWVQAHMKTGPWLAYIYRVAADGSPDGTVEFAVTLPSDQGAPGLCPRCGDGPVVTAFDVTNWSEDEDQRLLWLSLTTTTTLLVESDTSGTYHDGSDAFVYLECRACEAILANESGETRLRRAAVTVTDESMRGPVTDAQESAFFDLAEWFCAQHPSPPAI